MKLEQIALLLVVLAALAYFGMIFFWHRIFGRAALAVLNFGSHWHWAARSRDLSTHDQ